MGALGPRRIADRGRLVDYAQPLSFTLNGKEYSGFAGDTLASALIASDVHFVGRSFKYHRPRGFVGSGYEEPNALFGVGEQGRFEPNLRGPVVELYGGLTAQTQNHWPSLGFDFGAANGWFSRLLPAGFYYKTFLRPRAAWKHVFEPFIRRAAGLGKAPQERDSDRYEQVHVTVDVLVVGGGVAGLQAAKTAAEAGARVMLVEQAPVFGGRALVDGGAIDGRAAAEWAASAARELGALPGVILRSRTQATTALDHNYILCEERLTDHLAPTDASGPRKRLWRVRARRLVVAAGAIERPIPFANNDLPGVMLASAMRDYVELYGAAPGRNAALYVSNDDGYRTALTLMEAGLSVAAVIDARSGSTGDLPRKVEEKGVDVIFGAAIAKAEGKRRIEAVEIAERRESGRLGARVRIECDALGVSGGWNPTLHLWSQLGGKVTWDERRICFAPEEGNPPRGGDGAPIADCVGAAAGRFDLADILADGSAAGLEAARACGFGASEHPHRFEVDMPREGAAQAIWFSPSDGAYASGAKHFVDFQNDVTVADVELAAREGYESVEHLKRYTTLGMATDQGKLSNVNGLAVLADVRGVSISEVGVTTFRPPYTPLTIGSIAGASVGKLFKPARKTPIHSWHERHGAVWEQVGDWRRPFSYPQLKGDGAAMERRREASYREVDATRQRVGMLDASTLGKIEVFGPDAGKFLDLIYTNKISTLKPRRCRYALTCDDNGMLFDDGVVARLDDGERAEAQRFLCHTTSGGADRVYAWMEEWLQTEFTSLDVRLLNVTEQWGQINVAGPKAREVLEALSGDIDFSKSALPFMSCATGWLAGAQVRVFAISFTGELSYEIAVPSGATLSLWETIFEAGRVYGVTPFGTEALHIMRAEKGFPMIGDETDGTVTPRDLGLGWALSTKKPDYIGRRAVQRPYLMDPDRRRFVGLLTEEPTEVLPEGAHAVEGARANGLPRMIGHVSSSYWSPTLKRSIALAMIERGPERIGSTVTIPLGGRKTIRAKVVDPRFYDPENERLAQ
ncbi:MAG: sarcosine oxidase subunit alpha family protein [Neomegalonema sp.]|nr:sarcosine oxidase subunit alpha family protein [Neomegalonema sp.]